MSMSESLAQEVKRAARVLSDDVDALRFGEPTAYVYNPLVYARAGHERYIDLSISGKKRVVFLGMNPGPWGMSQTGVPFGEVALSRDWIGVNVPIQKPEPEHPKRPIVGFACEKSEVSGARLWGYFRDKFGQADAFFRDHWVANYCPLVFMEASSRNRTPDKLPVAESAPLFEACDQHLRRLVELLEPEWLIGVGVLAEQQAKRALDGMDVQIGRVLHPSPASPVANRGWAEAAEKQIGGLLNA